MSTLRTKFKKQIIAEFMVPSRKSNKVIIFCDGMPSAPHKRPLLEFFCKKGYWIFHPRYRGSWESSGVFMKRSPHEDILDVIDELPKGFRDLWDNKLYKVKPKSIFVLASSFGGAAALLASMDKRVTKVAVFSPVIDWRVEGKDEPHDKFINFLKQGFSQVYRTSDHEWGKVFNGKFYNPTAHTDLMDGSKILIIHAKDDKVVPWQPAQKFAKATGCQLWLYKKGGHLSSSNFMKPRFCSRVIKFINK